MPMQWESSMLILTETFHYLEEFMFFFFFLYFTFGALASERPNVIFLISLYYWRFRKRLLKENQSDCLDLFIDSYTRYLYLWA